METIYQNYTFRSLWGTNKVKKENSQTCSKDSDIRSRVRFFVERSSRRLSGFEARVVVPLAEVNAADLVVLDLKVILEAGAVGVSQDAHREVVVANFVVNQTWNV